MKIVIALTCLLALTGFAQTQIPLLVLPDGGIIFAPKPCPKPVRAQTPRGKEAHKKVSRIKINREIVWEKQAKLLFS